MSASFAKDPDDLHGDDIVFSLRIDVRRNGAMSVAGNINHEAYALAVLDEARQSIKSHNSKTRIGEGGLIIPPHDRGLIA